MKKRVLYATNGSGPARAAGELLRQLADPQRVGVTVNVCDSVEFAFPEEPWRFGDERRPRARPKEVADAENQLFRALGFEVDSLLATGIPAQQILEGVREGYDVTVLGAGSTSWLGNLLLGSTATRVLHDSPSSVLLVHRFTGPEAKLTLLVATDGSPDSELAVDTLIELTSPARASVTVVSVSTTFPRVAPLYRGFSPSTELLDYLGDAARRNADQAAARLSEAGFETATCCPVGDPVREILHLAEAADLVVVGSRGLGRAGRLLLGSVSDQVARLAPATLVCRNVNSAAGS